MSYINSALRKVQKERNSSYAPYDDLISVYRKKNHPAGIWRAFAIPAIILIFVVAALSSSFLYYRATLRPAKDRPVTAKVATPEPATAVPVLTTRAQSNAERSSRK